MAHHPVGAAAWSRSRMHGDNPFATGRRSHQPLPGGAAGPTKPSRCAPARWERSPGREAECTEPKPFATAGAPTNPFPAGPPVLPNPAGAHLPGGSGRLAAKQNARSPNPSRRPALPPTPSRRGRRSYQSTYHPGGSGRLAAKQNAQSQTLRDGPALAPKPFPAGPPVLPNPVRSPRSPQPASLSRAPSTPDPHGSRHSTE